MFDNFLAKNWFEILQSIFIVGAFIHTYYSTRNETRSRKLEHLFQINQSHRDIWGKTYSQPELLRIRKTSVDLQKNPVTEVERRLAAEVIMHIYSVYEAMTIGLFNKGEMEKDIADYLKLPIPNFVWQEVKIYYDTKFVNYIERLLSKVKVNK